MHPDKLRELLGMMNEVEDCVEGATRKVNGEKYEGVEFG
jgi:hypothetical protein